MKTALVVLNFGGPRTEAEVEPFLFTLFNDPDVIKLPFGPRFQRAFAGRFSRSRTPKITPAYQHIGFSPLVETTEQQVEALRTTLGPDAPEIHVGMRYTAPTITSVVDALAQDPPERVVAVALFPHYSDTTTGSAFNRFAQSMAERGLGRVPVHYVPAFYDHPKYVEAMVARIREVPAPAGAHLLFSAHGLPSTYAREDADPYPDQIKDSVRMIVRTLDWGPSHSLCFQSRVGPVRWLKPSTEEALMQLSGAGVKDVVVVPISFTTEGIETLYEIDVEFGEVAHKLGLTLHRVRTVDDHPAFIACLADVLQSALTDQSEGGIGAHHCVRCLLPKPHTHRTKVDCLDCGHRTPEYLLRLPPPLA